MSDVDDPAAVRRIGRDPEAFERFYRQHQPEVIRFIVRRVRDPLVAADLTAEVFLRAIHSAEAYRGGAGGGRAWLYGIARNLAAEQRRRDDRALHYEGLVSGRRLLDGDDLSRLEEQIDAARAVASLSASLAGLSEGDRAVLELVAQDGLSVAEAAGVLGIRPGTARARLHRARRTVRRTAPQPTDPSRITATVPEATA
jgi:RNA polymerase sigma-70 factor (ECF subfamily)